MHQFARLVAARELIEGFGRRWYVAQAHEVSDLAPEVEPCRAFVRREGAPAVLVRPAQREFDEGPQDEQVVVVGNLKIRVDAVHPLDRPPTRLAVPAALDEIPDEQLRVVVALLPARRELAGPVEQSRHGATAESVEQRHFRRAHEVEWKLVDDQQMNDALAIALGIQRRDFPSHGCRVGSADRTSVHGRRSVDERASGLVGLETHCSLVPGEMSRGRGAVESPCASLFHST